jgi:hypothetical protein
MGTTGKERNHAEGGKKLWMSSGMTKIDGEEIEEEEAGKEEEERKRKEQGIRKKGQLLSEDIKKGQFVNERRKWRTTTCKIHH